MGQVGERVPIPGRGQRLFRAGTVYWNAKERAFFRAGFEAEGPLPIDQVSGKLSWQIVARSRTQFRDQTGAFVSENVFLSGSGVDFGLRAVRIRETLIGLPEGGVRPGPDAQFVERITVLGRDGRVHVVNINHGLNNRWDETRQAKQWWRKMRDATSDEEGQLSYDELRGSVLFKQYIHQENLGPR